MGQGHYGYSELNNLGSIRERLSQRWEAIIALGVASKHKGHHPLNRDAKDSSNLSTMVIILFKMWKFVRF